MNYLAHLYLSGDDEQLMFGNFIADHVKGNSIANFDKRVQDGIRLHRLIDSFTDKHDVVMQSKLLLRPYVGKYSPVASDIIFDHFLASQWNNYHDKTLHDFVVNAYSFLDSRKMIMPERMQHMYAYMKKDNWLEGYAEMQGVGWALNSLSKRTKFESNLNLAVEVLMVHYDELKQHFNDFFPLLKMYCEEERKKLTGA